MFHRRVLFQLPLAHVSGAEYALCTFQHCGPRAITELVQLMAEIGAGRGLSVSEERRQEADLAWI